MHLAIIVVYMVKPENKSLLELHLKQIRTMTNVPYTIYAGVNQLTNRLLKRLANEPQLKICPLPDTDLPICAEHSFYLEHLIKIALTDGVTHLVTLHVDSFPIRPDWVQTLDGMLTDDLVLATVSNDHYLIHYTACLFFKRDFYLKVNPHFLLNDQERSSGEYQCLSRSFPHHGFDSGVGFVFKAFCQGLSWVPLEKTNIGEEQGHYGSIYHDLIFHLKGAARYRRIRSLKKRLQTLINQKEFILAKEKLKKIIPPPLWVILKKLKKMISNSRERTTYDKVRSQLLNDPESYIQYLRNETDK